MCVSVFTPLTTTDLSEGNINQNKTDSCGRHLSEASPRKQWKQKNKTIISQIVGEKQRARESEKTKQ